MERIAAISIDLNFADDLGLNRPLSIDWKSVESLALTNLDVDVIEVMVCDKAVFIALIGAILKGTTLDRKSVV